MDREITQSLTLRLILLAVTTLAVLLGVSLFIDVLVGKAALAFRDVSHFYHPLQIYLREHRGDAWFPLWSPLDSFGVPLAGETTTAIFYPPKVLLSIVFTPFVAVGLYVAVHLFWAGLGVFKLATSSNANAPVAAIAAVSYVYSGSIFFLYTNPPFLVGAAWLPWIVFNLTRPSSGLLGALPFNLMLAACCIAMSILGGDPQTPINTLLLLGVLQLWANLRPKRGTTPEPTTNHASALLKPIPDKKTAGNHVRLLHRLWSPWPRLVIVVTLASLLALPQIAASISWSSHSHRNATQPQSLGTIVGSLWQDSAEPPTRSDEPFRLRRHENEIYRFSVAPWHLLELALPYVSGNLFPTNGRISKLIPDEPGMWTPTLYCGLLPCVCLFLGLFQRRYWNPWLAFAIIAGLFALGRFGLYWQLVNFIPGYGQFRFPAKWLPLVTLGIVIHAAVVLSKMELRQWQQFSRLMLMFFVGGLVLTATLFLLPTPSFLIDIRSAKSNLIIDRFWGPLSLTQSRDSIRLSLIQTTLVSGGFLLASQLLLRHRITLQMCAICCLGIVSTDSLLVAKWQLTTVPISTLSASQTFATKPTPDGLNKRFILTQSTNPWPTDWRTSADYDRLADVERVHRQTWFSRWHLADEVAVLNNVVSIPAHRATIFWSALNAYTDTLSPSDHRKALSAVGAYLSIDAFARRQEGQLNFIPVPEKRAFVRWHDNWKIISPLSTADLPTAMLERIEAIDRQGEKLVPQVEVQSKFTSEAFSSDGITSTANPVTLVRIDADRMIFNASSSQPGFVQIMQMQEGNWRAYLKPQVSEESQESQDWIETTVHPTDLISQGLFVPKGNWQVLLVYQPAWFWTCNLLAGTSWLACMVMSWTIYRRRRGSLLAGHIK